MQYSHSEKLFVDMKKILFKVIGILAIICLTIATIWHGEIATIRSLKAVEGNEYLYKMDYKASYNLDDVISKDIDSNAELLQYIVGKIGKGIPIKMKSAQVADENGELATFSCTSFQAGKSDGNGFWYGRNYDYFKNPTLVTVSRPKKGYSSIAVSDMSHFGYSLEKLPTSLKDKVSSLAAIYAPLDGVNEKGLCTSIMAVPKMAAQQESGKHKVGTTIIMRLWLDRCATVQEALDLAASLDIRHDAVVGSGYHYMIADANGDCAVLEFDREDGWKSLVVRKGADDKYMLVTNPLLSEKYYSSEPDMSVGNIHSKSWWRYETVDNYLNERNGTLTLDEAMEILGMVHWKDLLWETGTVEDTQYTCVYDQTNLTLDLRNWNDYDKVLHFEL
jgi:hypothetical protein